jgi:acyl-CoA synthetase (NDP forming)/GNAT superfamily N-acetyltransferase
VSAEVADSADAGAEPPIDAVGVRFARDVTLADGSVIHVRPVRPDDRRGVIELHDTLISDTSAYFRFFGIRPHLSDELIDRMTTFEPSSTVSVVAEQAGQIVGHGFYARRARGVAEVAFTVADRMQGLGVGTVLLEDLAVLAKAHGFVQLTAQTLGGNRAMADVFRRVGLATHLRMSDGIVDVEIDLADDEELRRRSDEREWSSQAASMQPYLAPASVVVIGASRDPANPGHRIAAHAHAGFTGLLAVVRPDGESIAGVPGFTSLDKVPFRPELAVVVTPAAVTPDVLEECGAGGVRACVVITAGFSDGGGGAVSDSDLVTIAHRHGMRLLGPNCLGVIAPRVGLNATFASMTVAPGPVAFASQSGGVGVAVMTEAANRGIGMSSFVSLGNRADVSPNDLMCAWARDDSTTAILLYLESIGNPRRFMRIAKAITPLKPVIVLKSGRTSAGRRGAGSHTAALATDDVVVNALLDGCGAIRVESLPAMLDVVQLLHRSPRPRGKRLALVGNSGGPLILAADASEAGGLSVPKLSDELQRRITSIVPNAAATVNPVDLLATVSPASLTSVVDELAASGEVDAVLVASVALDDGDQQRVAAAIAASAAQRDPAIPVAISVAGGTRDPCVGGAVFRYAEGAVRAVVHAVKAAPPAPTPARSARNDVGLDVDWVAARRWVREAIGRAGADGWLSSTDAIEILGMCGITLARSQLVTSAGDAAEAAGAVANESGRVVLKVVLPGLLHKTEAGGVAVVDGPDAARQTVELWTEHFTDMTGVLVQQFVPAVAELLVGAQQDPEAGPLIVVAAGGVEAELLADRAVRVAPLGHEDALRMIDSLRTAPRLRGFRGRPVADRDAVAGVVARLGHLVANVPEVVEIEINPLMASEHGAIAVDVRARLDADAGIAAPLRG